jgi:hypothetical protein
MARGYRLADPCRGGVRRLILHLGAAAMIPTLPPNSFRSSRLLNNKA